MASPAVAPSTRRFVPAERIPGNHDEHARPVLIAYDGSAEADAAVRAACQLLRERPAVVVAVWQSVAAAAAAHPGMPRHVSVDAIDAATRRSAERIARKGAALAHAGGLRARATIAERTDSTWATVAREADLVDASAVVIKASLLGGCAPDVSAHNTRPLLVIGGDGRRASVAATRGPTVIVPAA